MMKGDIDTAIVEYLMLADGDKIASEIATGVGLKKAKDVQNRLTKLHNDGVLLRSKRGRHVYWNINHASDSLLVAEDDAPDVSKNESDTVEALRETLTDTLLSTIEGLKDDVRFLREELTVKNTLLLSMQGYQPDTISAFPSHPAEDHTLMKQDMNQFVRPKQKYTSRRRPESRVPDDLLHTNKFDVLSIDAAEDTADEESNNSNNIISPSSSIISTFDHLQNLSKASPPRKISPFVNPYPENDRFVKKTPARRMDNGSKKPTILVTGDSFLKSVTGHSLREVIRDANVHVTPNHGAQVGDMKEKISPDIRKHNPDIIVLHIGLNDCRNSYQECDFALNEYKILLDWIHSLNIIPVVSLAISPISYFRNVSNFIKYFNRKLIDICINLKTNFYFNDNINNSVHFNRGGHLTNYGTNSGTYLLIQNLSKFINFLVPQIFINGLN